MEKKVSPTLRKRTSVDGIDNCSQSLMFCSINGLPKLAKEDPYATTQLNLLHSLGFVNKQNPTN